MSQQRRTHQSTEQKQSTRSQAARKPQSHGPVSDGSADTARLQRVADHAQSATAGDVLSLQAHYGNRAVQRLLATHQVQAKLAVGRAHDRYEQEADRVAARVMSAPSQARANAPADSASGAVQAMPLTPVEAQRKTDEDEPPTATAASTGAPATATPLTMPPAATEAPAASTTMAAEPPATTAAPATPATTSAPASSMPEEESLAQAKFQDAAAGGFEAGPMVESQLAATHGQGAPLPESVRSRMETGIGADFSAVRVHTGGDAVQLNRSLRAQAFTHGSDVYMGAGKYNPSSADGQRLLAHELTHVVQQGAAAPVVRRQLTVSPAGDASEQEAEKVAGQILRKPAATDEETPA